jgi:hypothetical protein
VHRHLSDNRCLFLVGSGEKVRDSIVKLRDGVGGTQLAEMARDLLDGRIDIRSIARSSAYAEPLSAAIAEYNKWFKSLDPEDREKIMSEARASLRSLDGRSEDPISTD